MVKTSVNQILDARQQIRTTRRHIDALDNQITLLLAKRMHAVQRIGRAKYLLGIAVRDRHREAEVLRKHVRLAERHGLSAAAVHTVFRAIIALSRGEQTRKGTRPK